VTDDLKSDIQLINQRLGFIEKFITEDRGKYDDHIKTSDDFRFKVTQHDEQIKGIRGEIMLLKWMLGIVIAVGLAILGKLLVIQ
jgi:hypothetical protein